jgi:hypothetical protein
MRRIEFIPASLGSRPTSFRGPKIRARQPKIHQSTAEISPEVLCAADSSQRCCMSVTVAARMEPLQAMSIAYFPAWFVGFEGKPQFRIGDRNLAFRYRTGSPLGELPLPAQSRGKLWRQRGEKLPPRVYAVRPSPYFTAASICCATPRRLPLHQCQGLRAGTHPLTPMPRDRPQLASSWRTPCSGDLPGSGGGVGRH